MSRLHVLKHATPWMGHLARHWRRQVAQPIVWLPAALLLLSALVAFSIDLPVSRYLTTHLPPGDINHFIENMEFFGHGTGAITLALAIFFALPERRRALPVLLACCLAAGLVANAGKLLVERTRPSSYLLEANEGDSTFGQWLPMFHKGWAKQSFPSAHSANAIALAVALSFMFPRARWLFAVFAMLAVQQRIQSGAHYLSDTMCGAAIGWFVAVAICTYPPALRWLQAPEEDDSRTDAPMAPLTQRAA